MNFRVNGYETFARRSRSVVHLPTPVTGRGEHCLCVHSVDAIRLTRAHPAVVGIRGPGDRVVAVINLGGRATLCANESVTIPGWSALYRFAEGPAAGTRNLSLRSPAGFQTLPWSLQDG
jgi:hypothetical protein